MTQFCCDERRRSAVLAHPLLNGIDFLEVLDDPSDPIALRQRTLLVHCLKPLDLPPDPAALTEKNVQIEGGERIRNLTVQKVTAGAALSPPGSPPAADPHVLQVEVSARGDFSTYTLRLVQGPGDLRPPAGFDPVLSAVPFSFKAGCPSDFDCKPQDTCAEEPPPGPEINYLAKDYATFRQLMLDRLAVLIPQWTERSPADLGVALVEMLSYVGDHLSYQQDAVATESYLGTARRRASVRRHARLVDYPMHDGRNARAWVQLQVSAAGDGMIVHRASGGDTTKLLTRIEELSSVTVLDPSSEEFARALARGPVVFEPLHDLTVRQAHNEMRLYTWGDRECCLPSEATCATLDGSFPHLQVGDVLVFVETRGPRTGVPEDADPAHRHAVRLTKVTLGTDALAPSSPWGGHPVTRIEWSRSDRLPFPLCISAVVNSTFYQDVSVALGNIVLADHGMTMTDEGQSETSLDPDTVPAVNPALSPAATSTCCEETTVEQTVPRYRPRLRKGPITQASAYDPTKPASEAILTSFEDAGALPSPVITLTDHDRPGLAWTASRDLIADDPTDMVFVVEVERDDETYLRFGRHGAVPPGSGVRLLVTCRVGNGTAGNVGAGSIAHLASSDPLLMSNLQNPWITKVWNPLPAGGGVDPETIEHVRQNAPSAFRRQERAVTTTDYEDLLVRDDVVRRFDLDVQRAAATVRWTGSWHTVFVTVDRLDAQPVDASFEEKLRWILERYRMAGCDLEIDGPRYVPLELEMVVCVAPDYEFTHIEEALLNAFSNRPLPDGGRGIFHPDNLTFGQPVYLSSLYAAAQGVTGVDSVLITTFQRQGVDSKTALDAGRLDVGRLEVARLDNDPNYPERGALRILRG
ncbi:MAG: putative baseplate assembly protein [Candidatus Polarisedimenticolia bacterium]